VGDLVPSVGVVVSFGPVAARGQAWLLPLATLCLLCPPSPGGSRSGAALVAMSRYFDP
jgi:hypothetical protein